MKFGSRILEQQYSPWSEYYLEYKRLKELLGESEGGNTDKPIFSSEATFQSGTLYEESASTVFLKSLNAQIEKILLFFLYEQGTLADQLRACRFRLVEIKSSSHARPSQSSNLEQDFTNLAYQLLRLIQFVDLNLTGLRKILKKHDKMFNKNLSKLYLGRKGTVLAPLYQGESMDALIFLVELSYREVFMAPAAFSQTLNGAAPPPPSLVKIQHDEGDGYQHSPKYASPLGTGSTKLMFRKQFSNRHSLQSFDDSIENILYQIHKAREQLKESSEFVQYLAASLMIEDGEDASGDEISCEDETEGNLRKFSNVLNLLSTFLYMTNYYIVAPTSGAYAAKLGSHASVGSLIIGMTPIAALVSTLLYSWWTSYSYKSALIFASTCSVVGNLLYALGLPCNSITLVLAGRLLNGFGSARSINRRYIADSFGRKERTAASAWFVTAGALGMAAGPAASSLLHYTEGIVPNTSFWQDENSPGWLMFSLWTVFLFCLIFYFRDPPRKQEPTVPKPQKNSSNQYESGEKHPLLLKTQSSSFSEQPTLQTYIPVCTTFSIYFVLKLIMESLLSSTSLVTSFYFGWTGKTIGFYMAGLGLLMLPANMSVAHFSQKYSDRQLIVGLQIIMSLGCIMIMHFGDQYKLGQYITGSAVLFISSNALEGPNMSLLSKTIPSSWSKGIVNVGLLATEAGTLGRVVGDVFLTFCGAHGSLDALLNVTFGIMALISFLSLFLTFQTYGLLNPHDKDD